MPFAGSAGSENENLGYKVFKVIIISRKEKERTLTFNPSVYNYKYAAWSSRRQRN